MWGTYKYWQHTCLCIVEIEANHMSGLNEPVWNTSHDWGGRTVIAFEGSNHPS